MRLFVFTLRGGVDSRAPHVLAYTSPPNGAELVRDLGEIAASKYLPGFTPARIAELLSWASDDYLDRVCLALMHRRQDENELQPCYEHWREGLQLSIVVVDVKTPQGRT